jgi:hypothetical protein
MSRDLLDLMGDTGRAPQLPSDDAAPAERKTESCEVEVVLHYDNEARAAILVSEDGDEAKAVWLPKSQIEFTLTGRNTPAKTTQGKPLANGLPVVAVNLPEWLAKERGLI